MNPRCMPKSFDVRVSDRLIARGVLTAKELEDHINSLPDMEEQAVACETAWPGEEIESAADEAAVSDNN